MERNIPGSFFAFFVDDVLLPDEIRFFSTAGFIIDVENSHISAEKTTTLYVCRRTKSRIPVAFIDTTRTTIFQLLFRVKHNSHAQEPSASEEKNNLQFEIAALPNKTIGGLLLLARRGGGPTIGLGLVRVLLHLREELFRFGVLAGGARRRRGDGDLRILGNGLDDVGGAVDGLPRGGRGVRLLEGLAARELRVGFLLVLFFLLFASTLAV